jgi:invasion protein IalB
MRAIPWLMLLSLALGTPAFAQSHKAKAPARAEADPAAPRQLGKFEDWTAATHQEGGAKVCYAFTRVQSSSPTLAARGDVILTVTVQVDQAGYDFYTAGRNAFARDGKATVAAFQKGSRAIARSPGPHDAPVTDTFSLKGFKSAYTATVKACPPK